MSDNDYTTELETVGDYRASITQEVDAEAPDGDGLGYVFTLDFSRSTPNATEQHRDSGDPDPTFDLADAYNRLGDWQHVERWLRIFHDVVSFDYADLHRSGPTYVFVVTRAQAETWGCPERFREKAAGMTRSLWRQWAEGDVYYYTVERRVTWHNDAGDTMHTWEQVDSLSGLYGDDYAREEARAALAAIVADQ